MLPKKRDGKGDRGRLVVAKEDDTTGEDGDDEDDAVRFRLRQPQRSVSQRSAMRLDVLYVASLTRLGTAALQAAASRMAAVHWEGAAGMRGRAGAQASAAAIALQHARLPPDGGKSRAASLSALAAARQQAAAALRAAPATLPLEKGDPELGVGRGAAGGAAASLSGGAAAADDGGS